MTAYRPRLQAVLGGMPESLEGHRITPDGASSPHQSAAENVMLGREPTRFGFIRRRELEARAAELLNAVGWTGSIRSPLGERDVVDRRRVHLARAVAEAKAQGAPAVLVDDSGDELSLDDSVRWNEALARAAESIPLVVAVTTLDACGPRIEGVLVNHDARVSGPFDPSDAGAISAALGIDRPCRVVPPRPQGEILLAVDDIRVMHPVMPGRVVFDGISFEARAGCVTGLAGAQANELLASLSGRGFGEIVSGSVTVAGADVGRLSREKAIERGVVFATEHPLSYEVGFVGGIPSRVSAERLRTLARTGMIDAAREYRPVTSASLLQTVGVGRPPSRDDFEGMLSALVAGSATVVLLAEPLLGLEGDGRAQRVAMIDRLAAAGKAVVVSASPDDLAMLADEALIVVHGRVRETITRGTLTSAALWRGIIL
ncbi:hypothetical protein [Paramicrobacterium fandaimingii]|uniref:hypothetical protein n=1 Tax=Paramicrobacterium fandaimingii TaxID=2708079 RepID=UPI00141DC417|nr:hypothetical protein [Microbacterium fandaimingii]